MANEQRGSSRPDQAVTPNSAAFQEWLNCRQTAPEQSAPCPSSAAPTSEQRSSGSGGGSGGGGYGLALISSDEASQERIRAIMRDICEREKRK